MAAVISIISIDVALQLKCVVETNKTKVALYMGKLLFSFSESFKELYT